MIAAGLIASRFLHYLALSVLFGGAVFPLYGFVHWRPGKQPVPPWLLGLMRASALLALLSGIAWFAFTTAGMSGSMEGVADPSVLSIVILNTDFGRVWAVRLGLAAALILPLASRRIAAPRYYAVLVGSLLLLGSIAFTGHAGADDTRAGLPHRLLDMFHLAAAGIWIGALVILARMVTVALRELRRDDLTLLHHALKQFSGIGTAVVATLILTGVFNPGFLAGFSTLYGQVLLTKLVLFGAMLLLAAANRFWLTPRLASALQSYGDLEVPMRMLWASVFVETALAGFVLLAVGWLGTLSPTARG